MSKKTIFLVTIPLLLMLSGGKQVLAGGSDDPSAQPPETFDPSSYENPTFYLENQPSSEVSETSSNNDQTQQIRVIPSNWNWEEWGQPYWSNNQVCRDQYSNIACFSANEAQELGWEIPSQN